MLDAQKIKSNWERYRGLVNEFFPTRKDALNKMYDDLEERITDTITDNVNFWLPYINIEEIDVQMTDEMKDNNRANIKISFTVGSDITTREITFTIRG